MTKLTLFLLSGIIGAVIGSFLTIIFTILKNKKEEKDE